MKSAAGGNADARREDAPGSCPIDLPQSWISPEHVSPGHSDLSGEMALRIEKAFGVRMDTLMRAFDIAKARKKAGQIKVKRYAPVEISLDALTASNL